MTEQKTRRNPSCHNHYIELRQKFRRKTCGGKKNRAVRTTMFSRIDKIYTTKGTRNQQNWIT